jgi:hypothetical protein
MQSIIESKKKWEKVTKNTKAAQRTLRRVLRFSFLYFVDLVIRLQKGYKPLRLAGTGGRKGRKEDAKDATLDRKFIRVVSDFLSDSGHFFDVFVHFFDDDAYCYEVSWDFHECRFSFP